MKLVLRKLDNSIKAPVYKSVWDSLTDQVLSEVMWKTWGVLQSDIGFITAGHRNSIID